MTTQSVIACAPFRLPTPRPLTHYEWTVVEEALRSGYSDAGVFPSSPQAAAHIQVLKLAISSQSSCPQWRTSSFGPAPAVAPYAYGCLAAWYAKMDPASQARAIADIRGGSLLCAPNAPWSSCPSSAGSIGRGKLDLWEGSPQIGRLFSNSSSCDRDRRRTSYAPMRGKEMLELFRLTGGQLPPELQAAASLGAQFLERDFLIGIQIRDGLSVTSLPTSPDLIGMARQSIEEIAIIWAPGKGASLMFLLSNNIDPNRVAALLSVMMPDLLPDLIPQIPAMLPSLLPMIFGTTAQVVGKSNFSSSTGPALQPGTPSTTGVRVVDRVGTTLPTDTPSTSISGSDGPSVPKAFIAVAALALAAFLASAW